MTTTPSPAPLSPEEEAEFRRLAEEATPGPWRADTSEADDVVIWAGTAGLDATWLANVGPGLDEPQEAANARYIAAASPSVILRLLDAARTPRETLDLGESVDYVAEALTELENGGEPRPDTARHWSRIVDALIVRRPLDT